MKFTATIQDGKISSVATRSAISKAIKALDGQLVDITVEKHKSKRSLNQNAYWFGMLEKYAVPVFREYGDNWSSFSIHEYIMNELGYQEVLADKKGRLFVTRKHSSAMKTGEFEEFLERARSYLATEHGIGIPLPREDYEGL